MARVCRRVDFRLVEDRALGSTGLRVSRLGLGTMTWGRGTDEIDARDIFATFVESGGSLVDTADVYSDGEAERMLGQFINEFEVRDRVVIATKSVSRPGTSRRFDASRGHLLNALNRSLQRLRTDYIDLWQLHAWDPYTPLEETLSAVEAAITSGKVRYVGVSNYCGWQTSAVATLLQEFPSHTAVASAQVEYSLLARGVEREVIPAAKFHGMGVLAWSPLGRGVLTGKYRSGIPNDSRASNKAFTSFVQPYFSDRARGIVDAVLTAADGLGVSPVEVSLAWIRDRPGVTAPIVGLRSPSQAEQTFASDDLVLPIEISMALDDVSAISMGYPEYGWNQL